MIVYIINVNLYYILVTYDGFVCKYTNMCHYNQKHSDCIILLSYISNQEKNMNIFIHAWNYWNAIKTLSFCCTYVHVTMYIILFLIYRNAVNSNCQKLKTGHNISLIENLRSLPARRHLTIAAGIFKSWTSTGYVEQISL